MDGAIDSNINAGVGAIEQALDDQQDSLPDGLRHVGRAKTGCKGDGDGIGAVEGGGPGLSRPQRNIGPARVGKQIADAGVQCLHNITDIEVADADDRNHRRYWQS